VFRNLLTVAMVAVVSAGLTGCASSLFAGPEIQARETESGLQLSFGPTFFDYNTAEIGDQGQREVELIAKLLRQKPRRPVVIEGHTDDIGSEDYNLALSMARAQAVKQALITHGVEGDRLILSALGETEPLAFNTTEDGRARNRRVEVIIR